MISTTMMELIIAVILFLLCFMGLTVALTAIIYRSLMSPYLLLKNHGINGPKPLPFFGNFFTIISKPGNNEFLNEQAKQYGNVFGFYMGTAPKLAVADIEMVKEITVKHFDNFSHRGFLGAPSLFTKALGIEPGLIVSGVKVWRPGRRALSPSFSAMKMKLMVPLIRQSTNTLVDIIGEYAQSGDSMEIFSLYGSFTLEVVIATAFGQKVALQRGEANQLTDAARAVFTATEERSFTSVLFLTFLLSNFPFLEPLVLRAVRNSGAGKAVKLMYNTAVRLIGQRMKTMSPPCVKDLLQVMIDATVDNNHNDQSSENQQIAGFSIDFLLAGYETTASTLGYISYLLAMNPKVQEKLQAEIDGYCHENPDVSLYEAAQDIKYLEMVIFESLRLYTPVPNTQRHCQKTVEVGGVTIPKGTDVVIPISFIHRLPQYWPNPNKFDPERFTPEAKASRPSLAHMPFGYGPRKCVGLRYSLLNIKIALIEILKKFSFVASRETVIDLKPAVGLSSTPKGGVKLKIVARST